jgi:hypothetical protein
VKPKSKLNRSQLCPALSHGTTSHQKERLVWPLFAISAWPALAVLVTGATALGRNLLYVAFLH